MMTEPPGTLEQLGTALHAGDRDAVLSCFAADATLDVISGKNLTTLSGAEIGEAVETLLTGFDGLRLTPTSRIVSKERVVEDVVISGDHTGVFAGAQPTGRRVSVNVKLTATWGPDARLSSLGVEADNQAMFSQIDGTGDVMGMTGGLTAIARERHDGELRVTDASSVPAAHTRASARRPSHPATSRRRWVAAAAVAATLMVGAVTWRSASANGSADASPASTRAAETTSPTSKAPAKPPAKKPATPAAKPVIAAANPKSVPHVQAGKQLALKSDVLFPFDSAQLVPAATAAITSLAARVRATSVTGTIQVNGYTDNRGTIAYDSALSRARALAVAQVLQSGLAGLHVTLVPQGFGQANPIATNLTSAGQARNRRVTIVLPVGR